MGTLSTTLWGMRAAIAGIVALGALALASAAGATPQRAGGGGQTFTPVLQEVTSTPTWFDGIDGKVHVEYDLKLTNSFPVNATVTSLQVRRRGGGVLATLTGDGLLAAISPLGSPASNEVTLPPAGTALAYIDLTVNSRKRLPRRLVHTVTADVEPGLPVPPTISATGAPTRVDRDPPIQIASPVSGPGWAAIIGAHRRAMQPINGRLTNGQRYAIDWNRVDAEGRAAFGDPASFSSNPSYGQPVKAVGDAKVVRAVDGIADQPPDSFTPVPLELADGNYVVLKLRRGVYAAYAHLVPGSVRVERGDTVREGDVLGALGNSGNSNGPHLHFQLMDGPSLLNSDALPLVFKRVTVTGSVPSLDVFGEAYVNQTPVSFTTELNGTYRNAGPVGLPILRFP